MTQKIWRDVLLHNLYSCTQFLFTSETSNVDHTKTLLLPCFALMVGLILCPLQAAGIFPLTSVCAYMGPRYGENCSLKADIYQGKESIRLVNMGEYDLIAI